jgi:hypothetical protein
MGDLEWTEGLDEWAGQGEAVIQAPGPSVPGKCGCCHHGSGGRNADVVVVFREQAVVGYRLSEIDFNDVSSWKSGWVDDHRPRMAAVHPHNPEDAQNLQERP